VSDAVGHLRAWLGPRRPRTGLVLGSGLDSLVDRMEDTSRLAYGELPGMPAPDVPGHAGEFVAGWLAGVEVLVQRGRLHLYEGHPPDVVALPVRLMAASGVEVLVLTNAAGGINPAFAAGTIMLVTDHLNLTGTNPLRGPVRPGEARFPDMATAHDPGLRALAHAAARDLGIPAVEGVYAGVMGPSYETPAEVRMLRTLGADAVGMSTVLEVIAARSLGLRCLVISAITNPATGLNAAALSHADVLASGQRMAATVGQLIEGVLQRLDSA